MNNDQNDIIFRENLSSRPPRKRNTAKKFILIPVYVIVVAALAVSAFFISNAIISGRNEAETTAPPETTLAPETTADPYAAYEIIQVAKSEIYKGELILVNTDFGYVPPTLRGELRNIWDNRPKVDGVRTYKMSRNDHVLEPVALDAFNAFTTEFYNATGNNCLQVIGAYQNTDDTASEHPTGLSLDLNIYGADGKTYALDSYDDSYETFLQNLHKYGFILRYPTGKESVIRSSCKPGHIRYVGVPHAYVIAQNNWCLEEYTATIRDKYPLDGEHLIVEDDMGGKYEIYYVAATGELTDVYVPKDTPYTISGNNVDGFVITVTLS